MFACGHEACRATNSSSWSLHHFFPEALPGFAISDLKNFSALIFPFLHSLCRQQPDRPQGQGQGEGRRYTARNRAAQRRKRSTFFRSPKLAGIVSLDDLLWAVRLPDCAFVGETERAVIALPEP